MVCPLGFQPSHNAFFYCLHLVRSYNGRLDSPPVIIFAIFCSLYQSNVLMNSHCFFDSLYICCKTLGTERVDPLMPSFPILNSFFLLPCLSPHSCNFIVSQLFHKTIPDIVVKHVMLHYFIKPVAQHIQFRQAFFQMCFS